jgi:hypothetical protein
MIRKSETVIEVRSYANQTIRAVRDRDLLSTFAAFDPFYQDEQPYFWEVARRAESDEMPI